MVIDYLAAAEEFLEERGLPKTKDNLGALLSKEPNETIDLTSIEDFERDLAETMKSSKVIEIDHDFFDKYNEE